MPGQYLDAETGFHYNYHRYYDPRTGRYLTPDPIGQVGGINLYTYAENNPVNLNDPEGQIVPALLVAWGIAELALSISDAISTGQILLDPCESSFTKLSSLGLFAIGMIAPGGGYSSSFKFTKKTIALS